MKKSEDPAVQRAKEAWIHEVRTTNPKSKYTNVKKATDLRISHEHDQKFKRHMKILALIILFILSCMSISTCVNLKERTSESWMGDTTIEREY